MTARIDSPMLVRRPRYTSLSAHTVAACVTADTSSTGIAPMPLLICRISVSW